MMERADLEIGMRVTVVPRGNEYSYFCGESGEIKGVTLYLPEIKWITPDARVQLDGWPRPMGFWADELVREGEG